MSVATDTYLCSLRDAAQDLRTARAEREHVTSQRKNDLQACDRNAEAARASLNDSVQISRQSSQNTRRELQKQITELRSRVKPYDLVKELEAVAIPETTEIGTAEEYSNAYDSFVESYNSYVAANNKAIDDERAAGRDKARRKATSLYTVSAVLVALTFVMVVLIGAISAVWIAGIAGIVSSRARKARENVYEELWFFRMPTGLRLASISMFLGIFSAASPATIAGCIFWGVAFWAISTILKASS